MSGKDERADPQAERLSALLEGLQSSGAATGSRATQTRAAEEAELMELAALAAQLFRCLPVRAPAPFKARLQADLQAQMHVGLRPLAGRRRSFAERWLLRLAGCCVAVALASASAVAASAESLPGQALYPVKRIVEGTRWALAKGPGARARVQLDIADTRLEELQALVGMGQAIDGAFIGDVIAARDAATAEAAMSRDGGLQAAAGASSQEAASVLAAALELVSEADRAAAERALAVWLAGQATEDPNPPPVLTATPASNAPHASPTPRPLPTSAPTEGHLAVTATATKAPPLPPAAATATVHAAQPPGADEPPATAAATQPLATDVPPTLAPPTEAPDVPTLDRGAQREATVRASTPGAPGPRYGPDHGTPDMLPDAPPTPGAPRVPLHIKH